MAEEFDIMKPISADLDIGMTMFDRPQVNDKKEDAKEQSAPKAYAPPADDGVYNADYGYLTAEEAEFVSDMRDEPDGVGKVGASAGTYAAGPVTAARGDSPLEKALAELEEELNDSNASAAGSPTNSHTISTKQAQAAVAEEKVTNMLSVRTKQKKANATRAMAFIIIWVTIITIVSLAFMIVSASSAL